MTVYNINLGIGWASSGVEYAQAYRAQAFRKLKIPAKFIFSDLILANNIADLTANLGFKDEQVIWLYNFFTDVTIAPSSFLLATFLQQNNLSARGFVAKPSTQTKEVWYHSDEEEITIVPRYHDREKGTIDQVSYVVNNRLIKREFYSYVKYATEYYTGDEQKNRVAFREFYNEDGTVAYTQHLGENDKELFEFPDKFFYSKTALYREMLNRLDFKAEDIIILDRMDEDKQLVNGPLVFAHHQPAQLVIPIHADHYDQHYTSNHQVLWNNFYEYQFTHSQDVAAYVVATDRQRKLLQKQLKHFEHTRPLIVTVPVGSLDRLIKPTQARKPHSLITASRLAKEKHIDWVVKATVVARQIISDLTLDIYGEGGERDYLQKLINENGADDYIHLMGQHDLTRTYQQYETYIAGSTSEGFGLSLMEAVGAGLTMIGFDTPYGNQTFIADQQNGYLLPYEEDWDEKRKVQALGDAIVKAFTKANLPNFHQKSYSLAEPYLTKNVAQQWQKLIRGLSHA